jgi:hypothetical protein
MTTPQQKYRDRHPDRIAATNADIANRTIKRISVRLMKKRDEDVLKWLEANYGSSGGPEILQALRDAMPHTYDTTPP